MLTNVIKEIEKRIQRNDKLIDRNKNCQCSSTKKMWKEREEQTNQLCIIKDKLQDFDDYLRSI